MAVAREADQQVWCSKLPIGKTRKTAREFATKKKQRVLQM